MTFIFSRTVEKILCLTFVNFFKEKLYFCLRMNASHRMQNTIRFYMKYVESFICDLNNLENYGTAKWINIDESAIFSET